MVNGLQKSLHTNNEVKSSVFTAFFGDMENAAELYRALVPDSDVAPEDISFTTLSGVMFMARKNDLAFLADNKVLVISEHQSTINYNMPLRNMIYYGRTMEKLIEPRAIYRTKPILIPKPEFYVFYNGTNQYPMESSMNLEDNYLEKEGEIMLKLKTKVININPSAHHPILKECRPVYEYSWFMQRIREYEVEGRARGEAVIQAMKDCESEGIMMDFIREHGTEASNMLFTEFNMEDALEIRGEERFEDGLLEGKAEGKAEGILDILAIHGTVPKTIEDRIRSEKNLDVLKGWLRRAASAADIQEFVDKM